MNSQNSRKVVPRLTVSIEEGALALGIHEVTLKRRIKDGSVRAIRLGRRLLIPIVELERLVGGPSDR